MSKANGTLKPALTMATPVTKPQAAMPKLTDDISLTPTRN
jgi:hypothetical protein